MGPKYLLHNQHPKGLAMGIRTLYERMFLLKDSYLGTYVDRVSKAVAVSTALSTVYSTLRSFFQTCCHFERID